MVYTKSMLVRFEIFKNDFLEYCRYANKSWFYRMYVLTRRRMVIFVLRFISMIKKA